MNEVKLKEGFLSPEAKYRAKPFWAWNGKLKKEELLRQIGILKEMGFGGFFMHSRAGLQTEYLGEEWFEFINACADEAEKLGMEAWLYDEDRYPSGIAGGKVTENEEYRARFLELTIIRAGDAIEYPGEAVAAFACRLKGDQFQELKEVGLSDITGLAQPARKRLDAAEDCAKEAILIFSIVMSACKDVYNGYSYLDTMNRAAVDRFLEVTHEKYKEKCQGRLGKSILGVFTDEPQRGAMFSTFSEGSNNRVPYTERLFPEFKNRFGYDLRESLPYLFLREPGKAFSKTAMDYVELCQTLFLDNFAKPMQQWCADNGMIFTGHVLHEDSLSAQTVMQGSLMRFYEYMDYPGVDVLTEQNACWWIVKQVDSVARQLNKPFELSELYGVTGWQMSLENYKQVGDWQTLFGINLRCPHHAWYTMKGESKRDYPGSIFYQSAWYAEYEKLETYFARSNLFMSQGSAVCELLVINPIESVWGYCRVGAFCSLDAEDERIRYLEKRYQDVFMLLVEGHVEFDYGEESLLERYGRVQDGTLWVGQCRYQKVLVSGLDTIRSSTLNLLQEFQSQGGTVIFAGERPGYVDGEASEEAEKIARQCVTMEFSDSEILRACSSAQGVTVSGEGASDILSRVKKDEDAFYVMLLNSDRNGARSNIVVDFGGSMEIEMWDARTGVVMRIPCNGEKTGCIKIDFAPGEEKFYRLHQVEEKIQACHKELSYKLSEENVFVLDMVDARMQGREYSGEVLKVDQSIRSDLGLPIRGGDMLQPWYIEKRLRTLYDKKWPVELKFTFEVREKPEGAVWLAIEDAEHVLESELNGKAFGLNSEKQWVDPCFACAKLPADAMRKGKNELTILYEYRVVNGLEAVYLLGNFGVYQNHCRNGWEMAEIPQKLSIGDITYQGLPFYSGKIEYFMPELRGIRKIHSLKFAGSCIKVKGDAEHTLFAPPYQCEIAHLYAVEVALTRRNTFGPLHCSEKRLFAYGPDSFLSKGKQWQDGYSLLEQGLLEYPETE